MEDWRKCENLLVVRPDNLGDVLMSSPAIRTLKQSLGCRVTLLTSPAGAEAAKLLPEIDETISAALPWVKQPSTADQQQLAALVSALRARHFDGCIIFSVYSQSTLPSAMLAWMAGIPRRIAYCRENPYSLLTHWVPDDEPYTRIRHQVVRDLDLAGHLGAYASDDRITVSVPADAAESAMAKLRHAGVEVGCPFILFHAGVSEAKRAFPEARWIALARRTIDTHGVQVLFTGSTTEKLLTDRLQAACGRGTFSLGGLFDIREFAAVIQRSAVVVSVNTATPHLAAALGRPLVVLYAQTNPQHTPWRCRHEVFAFSVLDETPASRNEVIRYVNRTRYKGEKISLPDPAELSDAIDVLLREQGFGKPLNQ